jgi:hypothetical protein
MNKSDTTVDRIIKRLKNNKLTASLIFIGLVIIAIGNFTDAINKITSSVSVLGKPTVPESKNSIGRDGQTNNTIIESSPGATLYENKAGRDVVIHQTIIRPEESRNDQPMKKPSNINHNAEKKISRRSPAELPISKGALSSAAARPLDQQQPNLSKSTQANAGMKASEEFPKSQSIEISNDRPGPLIEKQLRINTDSYRVRKKEAFIFQIERLSDGRLLHPEEVRIDSTGQWRSYNRGSEPLFSLTGKGNTVVEITDLVKGGFTKCIVSFED